MGMGYSSFMGWFGDSMESCDGAEPGFAVGGSGPLMDTLPSFWRQDSKVGQFLLSCPFGGYCRVLKPIIFDGRHLA